MQKFNKILLKFTKGRICHNDLTRPFVNLHTQPINFLHFILTIYFFFTLHYLIFYFNTSGTKGKYLARKVICSPIFLINIIFLPTQKPPAALICKRFLKLNLFYFP